MTIPSITEAKRQSQARLWGEVRKAQATLEALRTQALANMPTCTVAELAASIVAFNEHDAGVDPESFTFSHGDTPILHAEDDTVKKDDEPHFSVWTCDDNGEETYLGRFTGDTKLSYE